MTDYYYITGTDTGIGKTFAACSLARQLAREGRRVACCKPLASGTEIIGGREVNDDVEKLKAAATVALDEATINPYRFRPAIAPHIAAWQAGIGIDPDRIAAALEAAGRQADAVLIEGFGGWLAPLAMQDHTTLWQADIARLAGARVILVVGMRLGCLNHALLTARQIERDGLALHGWIANHIDPGMRCAKANLTTLERLLGTPYLMRLHHQPPG